jgi:hypothetical protein
MKNTTKRLEIREAKVLFEEYQEPTLEELISILQEHLKEGYTKPGFDVEWFDSDNVGVKFTVTKTRPETDVEYERRKKLEEGQKESRKLMYEQLKKEFGGQ